MNFLSIIIALVVTVVVGYFILKKYKPHVVLLVGGIVLLTLASLLHTGTFLEEKYLTGFWLFDIFEFIFRTIAKDASGIGLILMAVGGFAVYMEKIGASSAMVDLCIKPLRKLNAPYLVLALGYVVGQLLNLFIPSAVGLGVLLMATLYPVLIELGVSRLSATSVVVTASCLDLGPASGASIAAAEVSGLDAMPYFIRYQLPVGAVVILVIALTHFFVQRSGDRKMGHTAAMADDVRKKSDAPKIYAFLPLLPLVLLFVFSKLVVTSIKMNVVTAMLISITIAMIFELFRKKGQARDVFKSIQIFFNGMGEQFATVVTLIVAGEVFAAGLTAIGAIDIIIDSCSGAGFGAIPMTIVMVLVISGCAIFMGSAGAPFYAFIPLAATIAPSFGVPVVLMAMPMQLCSGIARSMSPISAVTLACVGRAEAEDVTSIDVVKRSFLPMLLGMIVMIIATFVMV